MERKQPFHLYGTTPDAPDAPTPDCISPQLMNRLIAIAIIVVAIVTFQEWHRQQTAQRNAELEATLAERDKAIGFLIGEGGVAEMTVQRLKAEGGVTVGATLVVPPATVVVPQKPQTTRREKKPPTKLNGQTGNEVYSGDRLPVLPVRY